MSPVSPGIHELAIALNGPGEVSFPTRVLPDERYEALFRHSGVLSPTQLKGLFAALERADETKLSFSSKQTLYKTRRLYMMLTR